MDYETADGSQFSLREVVSEAGDFEMTLITAFVDGTAYAGKSDQRMEDIDDVDVLQYLEPIPLDNIFPLLPGDVTLAPFFNAEEHYLKSPQFTYDDIVPGRTFVADTLLREAKVLELLRERPHPGIVAYNGAVVKDRRITHLCLKRCGPNLVEYCAMVDGVSKIQIQKWREQVRAGIEHLHGLGMAHNDINPYNICIDKGENAVIVDFDSCLSFGETIPKGLISDGSTISARENDLLGLRDIQDFLASEIRQVSEPSTTTAC